MKFVKIMAVILVLSVVLSLCFAFFAQAADFGTEKTVFISADAIKNNPSDWKTDSYDGLTVYYKGNSAAPSPYALFESKVSGAYHVWALCKKGNSITNSEAALNIGQVTAVFSASESGDAAYRWEKDANNSVLLLEKGEVFALSINASQSGANGKIAAIALVPATLNFEAADNTINPGATELKTLQNQAFTEISPAELQSVSVTVNGTATTANPYYAMQKGAVSQNKDGKGNPITAPTVLDALLVSAISDTSGLASARITLNGTAVTNLGGTILKNGDTITYTVPDNTNFAPVCYNDIKNAIGGHTAKLKFTFTTAKLKQSEIGFALNADGTLVTPTTLEEVFGANKQTLKGCYLNGYIQTTEPVSGTTSAGESYILPVGSKVYFRNVKIEEVVNPESYASGILVSENDISIFTYDTTTGFGDNVIKKADGTFMANPTAVALGFNKYDYTNLYITNKNTASNLHVEKLGGKYAISADSYCFVTLYKATYTDSTFKTLQSAEFVDGFIGAGVPMEVAVAENQRVFVWNNSIQKDGDFTKSETQMIPLMQPLEAFVKDADQNPVFPAYAKENFEAVKVGEIQNESNKIVFYQGTASNGKTVVQTEIYTKDSTDNWILVKMRTEDNGFLMMKADDAVYLDANQDGLQVEVTYQGETASYKKKTDNFYEFGESYWLIPSGVEMLSDTQAKLTFTHDLVDFSAIYSFDSLVQDAKVTIDAAFTQNGAYSFAFFNGDGVAEADFDTVTAPFLYIKHAVPETATVLCEPYLFTPMNTLYFKNGGVKAGGEELTMGVAVDPSCVKQGFNPIAKSDFGTLFRTADGKVRSAIVAPVMGCPGSEFRAGDRYTFSVRLLNHNADWYAVMKHVAQDMYNCNDIRTNYYGTVNDTIFNTTDLLLDDVYSGWDSDWWGFYNAEVKNVVGHVNFMSLYQRYLLTENSDLAQKRVVPTIAYLLSRGAWYYSPTDDKNENVYVNGVTPLRGNLKISPAVYGGLYEMSGGRMPYLLDYAITKTNMNGIMDNGAYAKYLQDESYHAKIIAAADSYLETYANAPANRDTRVVNSFIYNDYYTGTFNLLAAYELTGEQKYLTAAEEMGRLLMAAIWTTDYQNNYATTDFYIDPVKQTNFKSNADRFNFWWKGSVSFRLGNQEGETLSPMELMQQGKVLMEEETVPGWLLAKSGMGTEHLSTPGNDNIITMNGWAGTMVKLSEYTGDDWFETQARNAIIGRFQNYPGYYIDRSASVFYKKEYPTQGPSFSSNYYHHIPVYLSMVEDFLVNEAWAKSDKQIEFPQIAMGGYAYFNANQFGHASGKFYDVDGLWLWNDRGIVTTDSVNIDFIAAKKEGVVAIAFMNEDNAERITTVTLGDKVGAVNGTAKVYDASGNRSSVAITDSQFVLTIPAKGIQSVIITDLSSVHAPEYAKDYSYSAKVYNTMSAHKNGNGYVIQLNDNEYYAYLYITDQNGTAKLNYNIGTTSYSETSTDVNHDWLIKVDDPTQSFTYSVEYTPVNGTKTVYGGGLLEPLSKTLNGTAADTAMDKKLSFAPQLFAGTSAVTDAALQMEISQPIDVAVQWFAVHNAKANEFKLVIGSLPEGVTDIKHIKGYLVNGTFTSKATGVTIPFKSYITEGATRSGGYEIRIKGNDAVNVTDYNANATGKFEVQIVPRWQNLQVSYHGSQSKNYRFVITDLDQFKSIVGTEGNPYMLAGHKVKGTATSVADTTDVREFESVISQVIPKGDGVILLVPQTDSVPTTEFGDGSKGTFDLKISAVQ